MTPLEVARTQVGVVEGPGNTGIPFDRYAFDGEQPLPWCARFVRWCFIQAGLKLPGNRWLIARVAEMVDALAKGGGILPAGTPLEPGDLIFFRNRGGSDGGDGHHVAILEGTDGDRLVTIEGNLGDRVQRYTKRRRSDPDIWCIGRWPARAFA